MCLGPLAGDGSLRLTGILYPRAKEAPENLGERCEEFSVGELDQMVEDLQGLDVCVEHNIENLVGKVVKAHKTHCDAIQVEAVVNASTPNGKQAVRDIIDKKLVAFSLSHAYDLQAKHGRDAARLQVALRESNDQWKRITDNIRDGHSVRKELRELSLCAEPARVGCQIHSVVDASAGCQQTPHDINKRGAAQVGGQQQTRVVGVFNCSIAMESTNENAPTDVAPDPGADAGTAPKGNTPEGEAPTTTAQGEEKQPRDPSGRYSTKEQAPSDKDDENKGGAVEMETITDSLRQAGDQIKSQAEMLAVANTEKEALANKLAEMEAQVAAATQAATDAREAAEQQKLQAETKAREQAEQRRSAALSDLQKLLKCNDTLKKGSEDEATRVSGEAALVEAAIKAVQSQKQQGEMTARDLDTVRAEKALAQREKENVVRSLTNFGVHQPTHGAMVNASKRGAEELEEPQSKKQMIPLVSMCEYGASNPNALWRDFVAHYEASGAPPNVGKAGIMNASNGVYRPSTCFAAEDTRAGLCAEQCQPYLMKQMRSFMTGIAPGEAATASIVDDLRKPVHSHRRPPY